MTALTSSLLAIDAELQRQFADLSTPMHEVCIYATAGGRRTRALLLLGATRQAGSRAILAATALELIHAATLLQDDIFDAGDLRRGRPAAHRRFGKPLAILASDWLLIRALELAADVDLHFFRCLARSGAAMAQAEARELLPLPLSSLREAQRAADTIARGKTAVLFGTALCGAAVLQGVTPEDRARWEQLGVEMGITYQVVDDCIDLYGVEAAAGKTLGHDLLAGCFTVPMFLAALSLERHGTPVSLEYLRAGSPASPDFLRLKRAVHSVEVMAQVHDTLQERFAAHRIEAADAGVPALVIANWQADLQARLGPCFTPTSEVPAFPVDTRLTSPA